jgi:carboxyl-terminal processing protease
MRPQFLLLNVQLALAVAAFPLTGAETVQSPKPLASQDKTLVSSRYTNGVPNPTPLIGGDGDSNILQIVSKILQSQHYSRRRFDDDLSSKFFDRYLDQLDAFHIYLTQADVQEFEKYRFKLDEFTLLRGDAGPARQIFSRFRERLAQQYDLVIEMLKNDKFDFKGKERFAFDRKKLPRPSTLADAKKLWRERLRYEYLQEKLGKEKPEETGESSRT